MDSISKSDIDKIFGKILRKFRKKIWTYSRTAS